MMLFFGAGGAFSRHSPFVPAAVSGHGWPDPPAPVPGLRQENTSEPEWPQGHFPLRRRRTPCCRSCGVSQTQKRLWVPGMHHKVSFQTGSIFSKFSIQGLTVERHSKRKLFFNSSAVANRSFQEVKEVCMLTLSVMRRSYASFLSKLVSALIWGEIDLFLRVSLLFFLNNFWLPSLHEN